MDELIHKYIDRVYGFIYHMTKDSALAEDATQETFIKVWKNINKIRRADGADSADGLGGDRNLAPWIFAIAKNAAIDILRKKKDVSFNIVDPEDEWIAETIEDENILPDNFAENARLDDVLDKVLLKISPDSRAVVILHDKEGMTFEEIAEILDEPMNTVKSRYRRALTVLKKLLIELGYGAK